MSSAVPVELYRTIERANACAKAAALEAAPAASFGVRRLTPADFVAELWELWGDGRALVSADERKVLVAALLREFAAEARLSDSPGTVALIARFVSNVGCLLEGQALDETSFTARERGVLALAAQYCERLRGAGLVEPEQAAALLSDAVASGEVPSPCVSVVDAIEAGAGLDRLLRVLDCSPKPDAFVLPTLAEGVEPALVMPAGPTALAGLLLDEITEVASAGETALLVVSPAPDRLFESLAAPLSAAGVSSALRCSRPFEETLTGCALAAVADIDGPHGIAAATDFAYNRLSGVPGRDAQRLNREIREDRTFEGAAIAEKLRLLSPTFSEFQRIAEVCAGAEDARAAEDALRALDVLAEWVKGVDVLTFAEKAREAAALAKAQGLLAACVRIGAWGCDLAPLLASASVPVQVLAAAEGGATVEFASLDRLDSLVPRSYDEVIVADCSQEVFPAKADRTALDGLTEKLGYARPADEFERERRRFAAAMGAAKARFTLGISQRDEKGEETYPAFLLSEFSDALTQSHPPQSALAGKGADAGYSEFDDAAFGLPVALSRCARRGGEEALVGGIGQSFAALCGKEEVPGVARGCLRQLNLADFLKKAPGPDGPVAVLSASAIESYLSCPYGWFLKNRLRPEAPDEQFGPAEKGGFVHRVLARLYDGLAAEGVARVDEGNLAACEGRLDAVFDECLAEQRRERPGSGRLVARSKSEKVEVERLRGQLHTTLRRLATMAPAYRVHGHEVAVAPEDGIDYAGFRLNGRADRVDVDAEDGRFAIIDYKGSVGSDYAAAMREGDEEVPLPGRIQADVYAQALRRRLTDLHCAGALYLSYSAKRRAGSLVGAADATYDDGGLLGASSRVPLNFEAYLDAVEELAAARLAGLLRGEIAPSPRSSAACRFCPALDCERRLS
ncbi:PD-(D/E)XK nuclease family protein [Adlercreutzia shanghongiae]|uniref:PD-(D/E)XK nuclease family protein n=1 Tax=Adlercreutzia shanghongiae TaxID=3111773 RepID=A0ABU6IXA7_9ACTN|nr:PD-(D/E)XK nuclease family protein [Adlercreutzia sp. R22]MEC4294482.1 PD-(D/E)XK nuclease family protein [Adlercreutzia sp. R22]